MTSYLIRQRPDGRFVIHDPDTGDVVADADGHGFRKYETASNFARNLAAQDAFRRPRRYIVEYLYLGEKRVSHLPKVSTMEEAVAHVASVFGNGTTRGAVVHEIIDSRAVESESGATE